MVQILEEDAGAGSRFLHGLFGGLERKREREEEFKRAEAIERLKGQQKQEQFNQKMQMLKSMGFDIGGDEGDLVSEDKMSMTQEKPSFGDKISSKSPKSSKQIMGLSLVDPNLGRIAQAERTDILKEQRHQEDVKRKEFESNRAYHTSFSKDAEKHVEGLRNSLPKIDMALHFARDALESDEVGYFSPNKLADATGVDLFRTAKGAQLVTAGKENLLSNMSKVSARAQNVWFEQRLNSMFPKIGQSKEANLTVQEMLEGEAELDRAYMEEFDRLTAQDEEKYGYVKKDISKRASDFVKPLEKEILKKTTYRMKEIEEQEKGLKQLKSQVGKNVPKGTPFTLAMAKLYKDKYGDKARVVAEKNGYYIPSIEEFKIFQQSARELRE